MICGIRATPPRIPSTGNHQKSVCHQQVERGRTVRDENKTESDSRRASPAGGIRAVRVCFWCVREAGRSSHASRARGGHAHSARQRSRSAGLMAHESPLLRRQGRPVLRGRLSVEQARHGLFGCGAADGLADQSGDRNRSDVGGFSDCLGRLDRIRNHQLFQFG